MKCFVIDPDEQTIREDVVNWEGPHEGYPKLLDEIYRLGKFDCFDTCRLNRMEDRAYVDDAGLLKGLTLWGWLGYPDPLAGIGVVLGHRREDTCAPHCTIDQLRERVVFKDDVVVGLVGL